MQSYFAISRRVDAPRERVFRAWTDPREVVHWLGSAPFEYDEVDAPGRLVFTAGESLSIVTLSDAGEETVMTFEGGAPAGEADTVERGWAGLLDLLADQVSQSGGNAGGIRPA